jgi:excinuclease ABC subunit A
VVQLDGLVDLGNTVIVVEHDLDVVAASDYVIDMGPGAGEEGGVIVAHGTPAEVATSARSRTARYLERRLTQR